MPTSSRPGKRKSSPRTQGTGGLEALSALRKQRLQPLRTTGAQARNTQGAQPGNTSGRPAPHESPEQAQDLNLLHKALRDVTPLRTTPRAEMDRPKPPPLPRPRATTDSDDEPAARATPAVRTPDSDEALFRAMMADVTPMRDTGRVALDAQRRLAPGKRTGAPPDELMERMLRHSATAGLDDQALFEFAMQGTQTLPGDNRVELPRTAPRPEPVKRCEDENAALRESMEAPISFEDRLDMGDEAAFLRPGLPRRVLLDLRRGRWVLQGELDLHGLNREEARDTLGRFLAASLQRGRRCVRIIHGKGLGSPGRESILKQLSRGWLAQREEILAFCQARGHQGGSGALLVLLRAPSASPQRGG